MSTPAWGGRRSTRLRLLVIETYGDRCHLCGKRGATSADHVIPRSKGGDDSLDNLRPAHTSCNYARGNMSIEQWRARFPIRRARASPSRDW
ncbi:HNH endonuclease [Corynebacterium propinquum]|uniref:HNH endonuclease n=1 Tax=Corynebacterium propinquum TaxID=43769 RepID=UPI001EF3B901|nr:HNH endonuclease [Corynebacterium propinquum]